MLSKSSMSKLVLLVNCEVSTVTTTWSLSVLWAYSVMFIVYCEMLIPISVYGGDHEISIALTVVKEAVRLPGGSSFPLELENR